MPEALPENSIETPSLCVSPVAPTFIVGQFDVCENAAKELNDNAAEKNSLFI